MAHEFESGRPATFTECGVREHGNCACCEGFVSRRSLHSHEFYPAEHERVVMCSACMALVSSAAVPVLAALMRSGVPSLTPQALCDLFSLGKIAILVQDQLLPL